mmetsp:Transcript_5218/g.10291  ORF Transcript_5218/g.10291 Transcript_5218/m.10291 type:complete len:201 (-) Transcript_5218:711-1313(-)
MIINALVPQRPHKTNCVQFFFSFFGKAFWLRRRILHRCHVHNTTTRASNLFIDCFRRSCSCRGNDSSVVPVTNITPVRPVGQGCRMWYVGRIRQGRNVIDAALHGGRRILTVLLAFSSYASTRCVTVVTIPQKPLCFDPRREFGILFELPRHQAISKLFFVPNEALIHLFPLLVIQASCLTRFRFSRTSGCRYRSRIIVN